MLIALQAENNCEKLLREACVELDRTLRRGLRSCAESHFAACPLLATQVPLAVELIYAEFATRDELGQRPSPNEYYLRFPQWKAALQRQFAVHEWLRQGLSEEGLLDEESEPVAVIPPWLGRYELLEEINSGGVGRVYKAWQHGLERIVAVKVLRPEHGAALAAREQFCREARIMSRLRHPSIMPVHDIGECDGIVYFSMDFMAGGSLADQVGARPAAKTVAGWLESLARAVHHAHSLGVIHCDLKPSNALLDEIGHVVLSDFGLAQPIPPSPESQSVLRLFGGSPAYMAPEQFDRQTAPGPAIDVWALGVMLYELLSGQRPFVSDRLAGLARVVRTQEAVPLRCLMPNIPRRLEAVCARCLAKAPSKRYSSAAELADDLQQV